MRERSSRATISIKRVMIGIGVIVACWLLLVMAPVTRQQAATGQNDKQEERGLGLPPVESWPSGGKRYALVIGVDKYQDTQITTLGGASNDARALSDALVKYAGFPADQVILLASDQPAERQPTRGNIIRRLSNLRSVIPSDGLLLISFAGHGMERNKKAFLLPADAQVSGDVTVLEDTAISVESMKERIKQTGVKQVVIVMDACRNDPAGRAEAPNPLSEAYTRGFNFDVRNKEVSAFATLYATDVGLRAYEYTEKKQGYFTWALIEGLKGGAANDKGEVTLSALQKYVADLVPKKVSIDLGEGKKQQPKAVIEGYKADDLIISVVVKVNKGNGESTVSTNVSSNNIELEFWNSIKDSKDPAEYQEYLKKYPEGEFAGLAKSRIKNLGGSASASAIPTIAANVPSTIFSFQTVVISNAGKILKESQGEARQFVENLGNAKLEMVEIPGGALAMGSTYEQEKYKNPEYKSNESPVHQVTLPAFYMGKFEVTQAQWQFVAGLPKVARDLKVTPSKFKFEDLPVEQITWDDAVEFCARLSKHTGRSYRLPSEAEWEYACRAGTATDFSFGDGITAQQVNYRGIYYPWQKGLPGSDRGETVPVGSLKVANKFGLYDMHGNVWEYVQDLWHESYQGGPTDGSAWVKDGDEKDSRVCRGGSLVCTGEVCRSTYRNKIDRDWQRYDYGFRVVMEVPKK